MDGFYKHMDLHVGNNSSPTSTKNNLTLEFITEGQPSPLELTFGVELGLSYYITSMISV